MAYFINLLLIFRFGVGAVAKRNSPFINGPHNIVHAVSGRCVGARSTNAVTSLRALMPEASGAYEMSSRNYTELLPPLDKDTYDALKTDIRSRGVITPIIVDEKRNIIDGYHRQKIANELAIECPTITRKGLSEEEKQREAVDLNLHRRHLSAEQRREIVARLNREGRPQREIAQRLGVSQMTVSRDLGAVQSNVSTGNKGSANRRIAGKDGKSYPAKRKIPSSRKKPKLVNFDGFQRAITILGMFDTDLPEASELVARLDDNQKKDMRRQVEVGLFYLEELNTNLQSNVATPVSQGATAGQKPPALFTSRR